jgi:type IV pilus biogenesis protein CpaD/CtpE
MRNTVNPVRVVLPIVALAVVSACASTSFTGEGGDRRFYEARCGVCHVPFPREDHAAAEWRKILDVMAPRAGLTRAQRERVFGYLAESAAVCAADATDAGGASTR